MHRNPSFLPCFPQLLISSSGSASSNTTSPSTSSATTSPSTFISIISSFFRHSSECKVTPGEVYNQGIFIGFYVDSSDRSIVNDAALDSSAISTWDTEYSTPVHPRGSLPDPIKQKLAQPWVRNIIRLIIPWQFYCKEVLSTGSVYPQHTLSVQLTASTCSLT